MALLKKDGLNIKEIVMMITHNPEIARMADRVIKLRKGVVFSIKRNPHPAQAADLVW